MQNTHSVARYGEWLVAQGFTPKTVDQRVTFASARQRTWGDTFDVAPHEVADWLGNYSGWTRRTYYNHLVSLFKWLTEVEQQLGVDDRRSDPLVRYKAPAKPRPKPNPLTAEELQRVFATADGQLRAWLLLAYLAGLRLFEIAKFRGEDITRTSLTVVGKGGEEWVLPTHPDLWELAQEYPRHGYWFPSRYVRSGRAEHVGRSTITSAIGRHFRSVGIPEGSTHRLRHSYGTDLHRGGVKIRVLQELLRHRRLDTTESYVAVDDIEKIAGVRLLSTPPAGSSSAPEYREIAQELDIA